METVILRYDASKAITTFVVLGVVIAILGGILSALSLVYADGPQLVTNYAGAGGIRSSAFRSVLTLLIHPKSWVMGLLIGGGCVLTGMMLRFVFTTKLGGALELSPSGVATLWRFPATRMPWVDVAGYDINDRGLLTVTDRSGNARIAVPTFMLAQSRDEICGSIDRDVRAASDRAAPRAPSGPRSTPPGGFGRR